MTVEKNEHGCYFVMGTAFDKAKWTEIIEQYDRICTDHGECSEMGQPGMMGQGLPLFSQNSSNLQQFQSKCFRNLMNF